VAYELVEHYWRQGRYRDALQHISTIPNNYKLTKEQAANHLLYEELKVMLNKAYQSGRTLANLEREEVNTLETIANQKAGFASSKATKIIHFFYGKHIPYYPAIPKLGTARSRYTEEEPVDSLTAISLSGYPNPAIHWMDVVYSIPTANNEAAIHGSMQIYNSAGQIIQNYTINTAEGIIPLNTSDWAAGIYFIVLEHRKERRSYTFIVRD